MIGLWKFAHTAKVGFVLPQSIVRDVEIWIESIPSDNLPSLIREVNAGGNRVLSSNQNWDKQISQLATHSNCGMGECFQQSGQGGGGGEGEEGGGGGEGGGEGGWAGGEGFEIWFSCVNRTSGDDAFALHSVTWSIKNQLAGELGTIQLVLGKKSQTSNFFFQQKTDDQRPVLRFNKMRAWNTLWQVRQAQNMNKSDVTDMTYCDTHALYVTDTIKMWEM